MNLTHILIMALLVVLSLGVVTATYSYGGDYDINLHTGTLYNQNGSTSSISSYDVGNVRNTTVIQPDGSLSFGSY